MKNLLNVLFAFLLIFTPASVSAMSAEVTNADNIQEPDFNVDWTCGRLCINGDTLSVPCTYRNLAELGYSCNDDVDELLESYERVECSYSLDNSTIKCTHANFSDTSTRVIDCPIVCISVDSYCNSDVDISGVGINDTISDFTEVLGDCWSYYSSGDISYYRYRTTDCYELCIHCGIDNNVKSVEVYTTKDLSETSKRLDVKILKGVTKIQVKNFKKFCL